MIKTNKLEYTLNKQMIFAQYDIFKITTSQKNIPKGALLLDLSELNNSICSILFESGKTMFVLAPKNTNIKNIIEGMPESNSLSICRLSQSEIADNILLQLLFNSMGNSESTEFRFSNLTGHLYYFNPEWCKLRKGAIEQIPCLEVRITQDFLLKLNVRTFTSELLREKIKFKTGGAFESYPQYIMSPLYNTLHRATNGETGTKYIQRQIKNNKTEIPFLDISNSKNFANSKMGALATIIEDFNANFTDLAKISFAEVPPLRVQEHLCSVDKDKINSTKSRLLSERAVRVIDCIKDTDSKIFCKEICKSLQEYFNAYATLADEVSPDEYNIRIIHNADYYDDDEDTYKQFANASVQHVTIEDFKSDAKATISEIINELIIKEDIKKGQISLYDWTSHGFANEMLFCIPVLKDNITQYVVMRINPNGTFDIHEESYTMFATNKYSQFGEILMIAETNKEKIECIIQDSANNINVISKTDWITIPEVKRIQDELAKGNTHLRGQESRHELFDSLTDIKMFEQDNKTYYFVGVVGKGMGRKIERASNIRMIEQYKSSELIFDQLLPLMDVLFVRNNQLTVLPFPVKYLREYAKIHGLTSDSDSLNNINDD